MESIASLDKETLEPPASRIADAASAREIVLRCKQADETRARRRALADGIYDGNPPVPPDVMRAKGRGGESNVNWREAEGMADDAKTPYYDIVFQSERYAEIVLEYGEDTARNLEWSWKASVRWKKFLDRWGGFHKNMQLKQFQMCFHGVAHAMWEEDESPLWKARGVGDVLTPDDAEADIDELETAVIPHSYLPGKLYRKIANESAAKANGWNVEEAKRQIMEAAPDNFRSQYGYNWEPYQNAIRSGDASWNARSKRILVVTILQVEFTGKVSRFVLLDDGSLPEGESITSTSASTKEDEGFLLRKIGKYDRMSQVIRPFFFDMGRTGEWHNVKGLGPKIFDFCRESNSLTNRLVTGAKVASGLIVQAGTTDAVQKAQPVEVGGGAIVIGPDLVLQQNRMAPDLQSPLAVKREMQGVLQSNTGQYRSRISAENAEPTLGQAQLNVSKESRLSQSAIDRYCKSADGLYEEMVRRALLLGEKLYNRAEKDKETPPEEQSWRDRLSLGERLSLEWFEDCVRDGVPKEALKHCYVCSVRAARPIGYGSAQMRMVLGDKAVSMLPTMDERARNTALRLWATAYFGPQVADVLFPRYDTPQLADEHAALATLENNALDQGGAVLVTPTQDHVVHLQVHFAHMSEGVQAVRSGANPAKVLMMLHAEGPHTKQHLDRLAIDKTRKAQFEELQKMWLLLSKIAEQLQQQIEEAMQSAAQNPPEPQVDPKLMAALAKVRGELDIRREKVLGDLQLRKERQDFMLKLKDYAQAHDTRLKTSKAASEMLLSQAAERQNGAVPNEEMAAT